MDKRAQDRGDERGDDRLDEHASRASALLASRANHVKAGSHAPSGQAAPKAAPLRAQESQPQPQENYPQGTSGFIRQNAVYIIGVAVVALVVALGTVIFGHMRPADSSGDPIEQEARYVSPYDWTKLDRTDGRYRYIVDGEVKSRLGIDVSENQHDIDWNAVAADDIDYAIVRMGYRGATEGELYLDGQYRVNIEGARSAGLDVGVYFFSQARTTDEAVEEADYMLAQLSGMPLEYPVAFDSETVVLNGETSRTTDLSNDEMTAVAEAFCARVEAAGYRTTIYGNASDLSRYDYGVLEQGSIWWAEYNAPVPAANIDIDYWQYSNAGSVAGIDYAVDMNLDLTRVL